MKRFKNMVCSSFSGYRYTNREVHKKKIYIPCRSEGELIDRVWDIKTFGSEGKLRK